MDDDQAQVKKKPVYGLKPTDVCVKCGTTVYPVEKLMIKNLILHRNCLRCAVCNKLLDLVSYSSVNGNFSSV
jgi:uncharacterized protein with PIN domain